MVKPVKYDIFTGHSMGASFASAPYEIIFMLLFAVQIQWTGAGVGTWTLEASNDQTLWTPISGAAQATGGEDGSVMFTYGEMAPFPYLRVVYTRVSGTGMASATVNAKGG